MMRMYRLAAAALFATFMFGLAVETADANHLSISNRFFRITWTSLVFEGEIGGGASIHNECNVILEGSFHSNTIIKTRERLIGYITRGVVVTPETCSGEGDVYILNGIQALHGVMTANSLPWHVEYEDFTGALPRISGWKVAIIGASILVEQELVFLLCLYKSTTMRPWFGIFELNAEGRVTGFRSDEANTIPRFAGPIGCPMSIKATNTGGVQVLGTTATITVRLI